MNLFRCFLLAALLATPLLAKADGEGDDPPMLPTFGADNITADGSILYVSTLASCTQQLVSSVCSSNSCPDSMPADINEQCAAAAAAPPQDPCAAGDSPVYNTGLHIGALFVIIFTSALGTVLPILGKHHTFFSIDAYILCLGKCLGIGILLACALVHMLQPANEELTSSCLGPAFTDEYTAYAYLFAMLAIMLMQFIDFGVEQFLVSRMEERLGREGHGHGQPPMDKPKKEEGPEAVRLTDVKPRSSAVASEESPALEKPSDSAEQSTSPNGSPNTVCVHMEIQTDVTSYGAADISNQPPLKLHAHHLHPTSSADETDHVHKHGDDLKKVATSVHDHDDHAGHEEGHSHVHSVLLIKGLKRTISAWLLEFGVSVHSVFIGLTTGITGEAELKVLLVALSFHQCFEGVALGSRIAEANIGNVFEEILMVLIFVLSAPIGMAVGIGVTHTLNPNGQTYNLTAGTFDGVCAGILLYIGLSLLLKDFPADMNKYAKKSPLKKLGMFLALWVGGGVMAFIGRYL